MCVLCKRSASQGGNLARAYTHTHRHTRKLSPGARPDVGNISTERRASPSGGVQLQLSRLAYLCARDVSLFPVYAQSWIDREQRLHGKNDDSPRLLHPLLHSVLHHDTTPTPSENIS